MAIVEIRGHKYRYEYDETLQTMVYLGPVGSAPPLSQNDMTDFFRDVKFENDIRNQLSTILDKSRWPTANGMIYTEDPDTDIYIRKRAFPDQPKEIHIPRISIAEEGRGTWKRIWPVVLDEARKRDYDLVKVEIVYNEKWREWFEQPDSGWKKVFESEEETVPSYIYDL